MDYMGSWGNKDPDEEKSYGIDWSKDLADQDLVGTVTWSVVQGSVILSTPEKTDTITKTKVLGGTAGETCLINCHIVTILGEKLDGTMRLDIRTR